MAILRTDWLHAAGVFRELGDDAPKPVLNAGFDSIARNALGDYTLICNESISDQESQCNAWAGPNELVICGAMVTEPGKVRVRCYNLSGAPVDPITLNVEIKQLQTGPEGDGILPPTPTPPTPPGPGLSVNSSIIWRPGSPSSGNSFQTWAEIEPLIASTQGFLTIYVDAPGAVAHVPSTADTEAFARLIFQAYPPNTTNQAPTVQIDNGGRLRNPAQFVGVQLKAAPTATIPVLGTIDGAEIIFREGASLSLEPGAAVPAVQLQGNFQEVAFALGSRPENNSGNPALSVIDIPTPGNTAILGVYAELGNSGPPQVPSNLIQGPAGVTLVWVYDSSGAPVAQPNFAGTVAALPADWALGTAYDDALIAPALGATNVQAAIDALKVLVAAAVGPIANLRWVSPASGNDLTGNGSIAKPFATVTAAYASITDAAPTKRYAIMVTGRMTEGVPIAMKANVYIVGTNGVFSSRVQAASWALDASWTPAGDCRGGFIGCTVAGNIVADFRGLSSNEGKFAFFGCWVNGSFTMTAFSLINQLIVENSRTFGAWNIEGSYSGRNNYWGGSFAIAEDLTNGTRFQLESDNDHFESGCALDCNNSTANVAVMRAGTCAQLTTTRQAGGTGSIALSATADFLSGTVTLDPSTTLTQLTAAKAIAFAPAGTANPSTEAQTAITVAGALPSFVYDPFGVAGGTTYTSLLALLAAAALIPGSKNIEMRNAFPVLPVGTYDFTNCEVRGQSKGVTLTFPAGARIAAAAGPFLSGLPSKITDINFAFDGGGADAGNFCTLPSNNEITLQLEDADLIASAGAAGGSMFKIDATTQLSLTLLGSSKVLQNSEVAGWNMFRGPGGSQLNVYMACGIDGGIASEAPSMLGDVVSAVFSGIGRFAGVSKYTQTVGEVYYSRAQFYFDGGSGLWLTRPDARNITARSGNLAADQNNYALPDLAAAAVVYLTPTVPNVNISGFDSAPARVQYGVAPQPRTVINNGTGNANLLNASGLSLPYNQIKTSTGATAVLGPGQMGTLIYEHTGNPATGFWRFAKMA
jgi:hypothetical protein